MQQDVFVEPDSSFGKTCQVPSPATPEQTLLKWLEQWQAPESLSQQTGGETRAWSWAQMDSSSGLCLTRDGSAWRSGASACSLYSILETGPAAHQYYLSPTQCAELLGRASQKNIPLPRLLKDALLHLSGEEGSRRLKPLAPPKRRGRPPVESVGQYEISF